MSFRLMKKSSVSEDLVQYFDVFFSREIHGDLSKVALLGIFFNLPIPVFCYMAVTFIGTVLDAVVRFSERDPSHPFSFLDPRATPGDEAHLLSTVRFSSSRSFRELRWLPFDMYIHRFISFSLFRLSSPLPSLIFVSISLILWLHPGDFFNLDTTCSPIFVPND